MMHGVVPIRFPDPGWDACSVRPGALAGTPAGSPAGLPPSTPGGRRPRYPDGCSASPAETIDLPIFRSWDNSSQNTVNVRDLHDPIDLDTDERGRT